MYHVFEIMGTALNLMVPKVLTTSRLVTFTTEIFGIPLMKHSQYALKLCLVNVKEDKRACYTTKEAAIFATCIRIREHATLQKRLPYLPCVSEASWNI
jgi:hypothetical protein